MAAYAEIISGRFQVQSDQTRLKLSRARVQNPELFIGTSPVPDGLFNSKMGTTDQRYLCSSCGHRRKKCQGHPGHIALKDPTTNPLFISEARRWERVVCLTCGAAMFDPSKNERIARTPADRKLAMAASVATTADVPCPSCGAVHPKVVRSEKDKFTTLLQWKRPNGGVREAVFLPHEREAAFNRVSDETVRAFGRDPAHAHPRNLVIRNLQVPATTIRPAVRLVGPGGPSATCHDINGYFQYIIKANEAAAALPPAGQPVSQPLVEQSMNLQQLVYDLIIGGANPAQRNSGKRGTVAGSRAVVSLAKRLPRKYGRGRRNLAGCRVWNIARDTISGMAQYGLNDLGIPEDVARSLFVIETVQPENMARLMKFFLNGRRRYPGASRVWRAATGAIHDVDELRHERLEPGDRLYRDLITGDLVYFNRAPSLERSAINAHRAIVPRNLHGDSTLPRPPETKTFHFNVIVCTYYNADFDGDEMTIFPISTPGGQAEAETLAGVSNGFISTKNSVPVLGMVQDSTVGAALLSLVPAVDKLHAMALFNHAGVEPDFSGVASDGTVSGREAISQLLRRYPVSLERRPAWFSATAEAYRAFRPEETLTVIRRGEFVSGVLDNATVGTGSRGGVFHQISRTYGAKAAMECIFALQQMAIAHLDHRGFSVGIGDMLIPPEKAAEIRSIAAGMARDAELINERLIRREIIPPLGMTTNEFYERLMIEALKVPDTVLGPILSSVDFDANGLHQMVASGSKGNLVNIAHISGLIGATTLNGRRIETGHTGRAVAFFPRGDLSPEASGFVRSSYVEGLDSVEHYFGSMVGRNDLTHKALTTAVSGYAGRKFNMSLQSLSADPLRMVVGPALAQLLYGEDGLDARQVEPVRYAAALLSDRELAAAFRLPLLGDAAWHAEELAQIRADRDAYRRVFLGAERTDFSFSFSPNCETAVDVRTVARSVFGDAAGPGAAGADAADFLAFHLAVRHFCASLPLLFVNPAPFARRKLPEYFAAAVEHLGRIIRAELSSVRLAEYGARLASLQVVFDRIRVQFLGSLVAPGEAVGTLAAQAVAEPFTQALLNSHHDLDKNGSSGARISRSQEIMGAQGLEQERSAEMLVRGLVPGPDGRMVVTGDRALLQELADSIKLLNLDQLCERWWILYESFPRGELPGGGRAGHYPPFAGDRAWVDESVRANPLLPVPENLTDWCFRFELDRMRLVIKSISLETVVTRLREKFPHVYIVHTSEGAADTNARILLRVYLGDHIFRRSSSRTASPEKLAREFFRAFLDAPLRGLAGITDATVIQTSRHRLVEEGDDAGKLVSDEGAYVIKTAGTNLCAAFLHARIDNASLVSSSINDTIALLGIEAGRARIINEIRRVMGGKAPNVRHIQIFADQMTRTGVHTSFENNGLARREEDNTFQIALNAGPQAAFTNAALAGTTNLIYGGGAALMVGSIPYLGTGAVEVAVDSEFVKAHRQSVMEIISDL